MQLNPYKLQKGNKRDFLCRVVDSPMLSCVFNIYGFCCLDICHQLQKSIFCDIYWTWNIVHSARNNNKCKYWSCTILHTLFHPSCCLNYRHSLGGIYLPIHFPHFSMCHAHWQTKESYFKYSGGSLKSLLHRGK